MAVDLQESRKKINAIDAQIARLFEERMQVSTDVARYKMETGKPIYKNVLSRTRAKTTANRKAGHRENQEHGRHRIRKAHGGC